jgi:hypothetical protein
LFTVVAFAGFVLDDEQVTDEFEFVVAEEAEQVRPETEEVLLDALDIEYCSRMGT